MTFENEYWDVLYNIESTLQSTTVETDYDILRVVELSIAYYKSPGHDYSLSIDKLSVKTTIEKS